MDIPIFAMSDVPYVTTEQMIEVDRAMMEDYRIELIQMMENAGRNLAHLARMRFLNGHPGGKLIAVLAGTGGNGGGALVCARRLINWGANVHVYTTKPDNAFTPIPAHQLDILHRMQVPVDAANAVSLLDVPDLIIDGIIGYSLRGAPRGAAADLIRWANDQAAPVLSLDAPSGVDTTSGTVFDPAIQATATMTLALPKHGLRASRLAGNAGELYLADISVPPELYAKPAMQLKVDPIFAQSDVIRLKHNADNR
jgi:NAD(P)H-hydrate epimerase